MKINFSQIYEGWRNNLIPPKEIKEAIQETSKYRMQICEACRWHSKNYNSVRPDVHCTHCGCTLAAKTKCLSCSCPINKWEAVATEEQGDELEKYGEQE